MEVKIATTIEQVVEAWSLVYSSYRRIDIISENPFKIHTTPKAVGPHATVILGTEDGKTGPSCTMTTLFDNQMGLPLDSVYQEELDTMRNGGHHLMEFGLFANQIEHSAKSFNILRELMRWAFYIAKTTDHEGIIGVHPHHSPFYIRFFGFEVCGEEKSYATVQNRPVVLLRLTREYVLGLSQKPRGLKYMLDNPLPAHFFNDRFDFSEPIVDDSVIGRFLQYKIAS